MRYFIVIFILCAVNTFTQKISITAIGDIMAHEDLQESALLSGSYDPYFSSMGTYLNDDDLTFANLETPIDIRKGISGYPQFNSKKELLESIRKYSIDLLSLANNHSYDQGLDGCKSTLDLVNQYSIKNSGISITKNDTNRFIFFTVKNITIGYYAFTFSLNGLIEDQGDQSPYINYISYSNTKEFNKLCKNITAAKKLADVIIVSYHCGKEYSTSPDTSQLYNIKKLSEAGADVVLAHHPHVLQKVEKLENGTLVAWSLGNYISAQTRYGHLRGMELRSDYQYILTSESIVLKFDIYKVKNKILIENIRGIPFFNICYSKVINKKRYFFFNNQPMENILKMDSNNNIYDIDLSRIKEIVGYRLSKLKTFMGIKLVN